MVTVHGEIQNINILPAEPEGTPPYPYERTNVVIQMQAPEGTGIINVTVPSGATGGLALGKCRVIIDAA